MSENAILSSRPAQLIERVTRARGRRPGRHRTDQLLRVLATVILLVGGLVILLPFAWLVSTSLKPDSQVYIDPPIWIPSPIKFSNYLDAWTLAPFTTYYLNTIDIVVITIAGTLLSNSLGAYAFARLRAPGRDLLFAIVLSTMMLPGIVTFIPQFVYFSRLGWVDTWLPLTVPAFFGSPFYTFLLRQFFLTIPLELEDAARIDGASRLTMYWRIIMPLAKPALAAVAIFQFVATWSDFFGPYVYLVTDEKKTISVGLTVFLGVHSADWTLLMAAATTATIPMVLVFFFAQRYFIQGVVTSGFGGR